MYVKKANMLCKNVEWVMLSKRLAQSKKKDFSVSGALQ